MPKVSVIVPCFNYGHLLSETLDSVCGQTFKEWECIVVDDGSTDNSAAIARAYTVKDSRFSYVYLKNGGPNAARNAGLRCASGEYVQLLDADDLIEHRKLEVHVGFLVREKDYALVYGSMEYFTIRNGERKFSLGRRGSNKDWVKMWPDTNEDMLMALVKCNLFPVSAPVFRRSILGEDGYFDESLRTHEDWEFWLRLALSGNRFFGNDEPDTKTLIREHGQSATTYSIVMAESRLKVRSRIESMAKTENLIAQNRQLCMFDKCELGIECLLARQWKNGIRTFYSGFVGSDRKVYILRSLLLRIAPEQLLNAIRRIKRALASVVVFRGS